MLTDRAQVQAIANLLAGLPNQDLPLEVFQDPWQAIYQTLQHTQPEHRADLLPLLVRLNPKMAEQVGSILFQKPGSPLAKNFDEEKWDIAGPKEPPLEYLWPKWFPRREITIITAKGGVGKSTFMLDIIRRLLHNYPMPDGQPAQRKQESIIFVDAENYFSGLYEHTLQWRAAGLWPNTGSPLYRMTRPHRDLIDFAQPKYQDDLVERCYTLKPDLVAVDSYTAATLKQNNVEDVKPVVTFFLSLAKEYNLALVVLHHFRKMGNLLLDLPPSSDDVRGSALITEAARSAILIYYQKMGERVNKQTDPRLIVVDKANKGYPDELGFWVKPLHPDGVYLDYAPGEDIRTQAKQSRLDQEEGARETKIEQCAEWLLDQLQTQPASRQELIERGKKEGFTAFNIDQAKKQLGDAITDTKGNRSPGNKWKLADDDQPALEGLDDLEGPKL